MKRKPSTVLAIIGVIALISCQKAPEVMLSDPADVAISAGGSSAAITFTTNRDWAVSWTGSWITVNPSYGSASKQPITITISGDANNTYEDRTASLLIKAEDQVQNILVKQPANLEVIPTPQSFNLTSGPIEIQVEVKYNTPFSVEVSDDWITQRNGTKGLSTQNLSFSISENTTTKERNATITLKPQGEASDQVILVNQASLPKGAVDLGVIITKEDGSTYKLYWSDCNLGANSPEEYGDYYAWGETETKEVYTWETYKWANGAENKLTKYCPINNANYWDRNDRPDNKTTLDLEDDVARVKLGGSWRMPSAEEWSALIEQCDWVWTELKSVNGFRISSKQAGNENSIFIPAAGALEPLNNGEVSGNTSDGSGCFYWSSSLSAIPSYGVPLFTWPSTWTVLVMGRGIGLPVRPVTE